MFKRFLLVTTIAAAIGLFISAPLMAQSKEQGIRLHFEALELYQKAKCNDDLNKVVARYEQALRIFERDQMRQWIAVTANNLGFVYEKLGDYDKAASHLRRSVDMNRELKDRKSEAQSLLELGLVNTSQGQYEAALECLTGSMLLARNANDPLAEAWVLVGLASLYTQQVQYGKAMECFNKYEEFKKAPYDQRLEAQMLLERGKLCRLMGRHRAAWKSFMVSLTIWEELQDPWKEATVLNCLGEAEASQGLYDSALDNYLQALSRMKRLNNPKGEAQSLMNIGRVHQARANYKLALGKYNEALAICLKTGMETHLPSKLIGDLYLDMGNVERAELYLNRVHDNASLGRLSLAKKRYEDALRRYQDLWHFAEKSKNADTLFVAATGLGTTLEQMADNDPKMKKQYALAARYFAKAAYYTEDRRQSIRRLEREGFFHVRLEGFLRTAPYKGLARVLVKMDKPVDALKWSEHTKTRSFADHVSWKPDQTRFDVPDEVLREDDNLNAENAILRQRQQGNEYEDGSPVDLEALEIEIKDLQKRLADHVNMLRQKHPFFAAIRYPQPTDLAQSALKEHEWVLAYDVSESGVVIHLLKGKKVVKALFKPIGQKELRVLVKKFRGPLDLDREKLLAFDFATGKKLTGLLLREIIHELPKGVALIIVPDDCLDTLPFEALALNETGKAESGGKVVETRDTDFFGDRNPISYYQSITALTLARTLRKKVSPADKMLAIVDPVFSPDDVRLLKAVAEKRRATLDKLTGEKLMAFKTELGLDIKRLPLTMRLGESLKKANPEKTDLYEGMKAQKALLLNKDLKPYRSVVLATHGYFGEDLPGIKEPVLILTLPGQPEGEDGFLRMSEAMHLKLNADMVALTACQSGVGQKISGEGTMNMGLAFQYAGAKSVLMSLWSVAESSSVDLVTGFFRHLREGKNKLEALKLAREDIRKAGYNHPFFWAPFILVGEVD